MATINNFKDIINESETSLQESLVDAIQVETSMEGVNFAVNGLESAFTSSTDSVDLTNNELTPDSISESETPNTVILTGENNLDVMGDEDNNLIMGNNGNNIIDTSEGDDNVMTGDGDDIVILGVGDDTIVVNGSGTKLIDGGNGNDTFMIKPNDESGDISLTTFTGLNRGDSLKIRVEDSNGDGELTFDDVDIDETSGSAVFKLPDGTSFTLDGVTNVKEGNINYTLIDNNDGTWDVELT